MTKDALTKPRKFRCRAQVAYCNNQCDECKITVETTVEELATKVGLLPPELFVEKRRWKINVKKLELTNRCWWSGQYKDSPHEALRTIAGYTKRGKETRFSGKVYHYPKQGAPYYTYGPLINAEDLEEWLLAADERYGYPRAFWEYTIKQVKIDMGDLPPEGEITPRWLVRYGKYKQRYHHYLDDARKAIKRYLIIKQNGYPEPMLQVQVTAGKTYDGGTPFIPEDGDGISWLLGRAETLGYPCEYWKQLIDDVKLELSDLREIIIEHKEFDDALSFRLSDVPKDFEIRLSDELVLALDKINRPHRYRAGWGRANRIWPAVHPFYKRLWDEHARFRRRGKIYDRGAFITLDQADDVLSKTTLTGEQLEQYVIGIRKGTSSVGNQIDVSLPLRPNKWWAGMFGFWFSSGGYYSRTRDNETEVVVRFHMDSTVVPLFIETSKKIGHMPYRRYDRPSKAIKAMNLRARPKSTMILNRAAIPIMEKFGLQLPTIEQRPCQPRAGRKKAAKIYNVILPQWILEDDECMHSFIECYINGQHAASIMNSHGKAILTHVYIRFPSIEPEQGKTLAEQIREYLVRKYGFHIHSKRMWRPHPRTPTWELIITHRDHLRVLMDNFEIVRVGMRARLLMTEAIQKYPLLYEAIKKLNSSQIVLLGLIYEAPREYKEIKEAVPMRPQVLKDSLRMMKEMRVVKEENGVWDIDYLNLKIVITAEKTMSMKILQAKAAKYSERLLFQCCDCSQVYIKSREICGICEGKVEPVARRRVLRSINQRIGRIKVKLAAFEKDELVIAPRGDSV
uniref:Uncharacterized protein n=1 Tax=viral metagenome TaxID=1070528 RepID=A0A6M3MG01_9ZZZZ